MSFDSRGGGSGGGVPRSVLGAKLRWAVCGLFALGLGAGCGAELEEPGVSTCDPFVTSPSEVRLESVVGAGQAADGTVYVVDRGGGDLRAFVSRDGELYRQRVSGTGEGPDFVTVRLDELEPPLVIQVATSGDGETRMGVVSGPLETKTFTIGEQGEELSLLATKDAQALPIHDYFNETIVEYSAELDDGRALIVLRPRDFEDYLEFRVFFGPAHRLDERRVTHVTRSLDGGSTSIDFEVDGEPAHAEFPVENTDDGFEPGAPSLTIEEQAVALSLTTPAASPTGATYYCAD